MSEVVAYSPPFCSDEFVSLLSSLIAKDPRGPSWTFSIACVAGYGCEAVDSRETEGQAVWTGRWISNASDTARERLTPPQSQLELLFGVLCELQRDHASASGGPLDAVAYRVEVAPCETTVSLVL